MTGWRRSRERLHRRQLSRRRRELGLTIVLASHDPVLLAIADEVYELSEGRLEAVDRPDR
jgi:ABC-type sulfate/molybdate transport systems ATPase subunit